LNGGQIEEAGLAVTVRKPREEPAEALKPEPMAAA
jgi:hypothetical protein